MTEEEREEVEERVLPIEKLDRLDKDNFKKYILANPFYSAEVFGHVMTEEEVDEFIANNREMFYTTTVIVKRRRA